jgi:sec-independent protein translocase protein TatA
MGFTSAWHWIIVLLVIVIVFGAGKLPTVMGDLAKGIKNFKAGMKDDDTASVPTTNNDGKPV